MINGRKYHIGVIGTGFIARGLLYSLKYHPRLEIGSVLTRRPIDTVKNLPVEKKHLTYNIEDIIRTSNLVVECSGDAIHGTEMVEPILKAGLPVVTMNPELQITSGTILSQMGTLIEAEGDQPGTLAMLAQEIKNMGFKPIVYGNIKGFLNLNPTFEEMKYWANRQGISLPQVTAFTDGSKIQVEQALVANGMGATIDRQGLAGIKCEDYKDGAARLGELADKIGQPISDYVLSPGSPAGVFIVAKHDREQTPYLKYLKLGDGPNYSIIRPYHLCHLEIAKTINNVLGGNFDYNFNNSSKPTIQVAAIAKRKIMSGEFIERGLGSFEIRGEAVKICKQPNAVPITLIHKAGFVKNVEEGQIITFNDVNLPKTRAFKMWQEVLTNAGAKIEKKENQIEPMSEKPSRKWLELARPLSLLKLISLFKYKLLRPEVRSTLDNSPEKFVSCPEVSELQNEK